MSSVGQWFARPGQWARLLLCAPVLALGYMAVSQSIALTIKDTNPSLAFGLAPWDARVGALAAQAAIAAPDAPAEARDHADALARQALRRDPIAGAAVGVLAINAYARGDGETARRLFTHAERLTRRDVRTQLWMIEDAVERGQVADAIEHYDKLLRVSPIATDTLFPILASAIEAPDVRDALAKSLASGPDWAPHFLRHIVTQDADVRSAALLFADVRKRLPIDGETEALLIARLVGHGLGQEAWAYYAPGHPGADPRRSRDANFRADGPRSPFDWNLIEDAGASAAVYGDRDGGVFRFSVPVNTEAAVLQQAQVLPPGTYRLSGLGSLEQQQPGRAYWQLSCTGGPELGRVFLSGDRFEGQFQVPAGCPIQRLTLIAQANDVSSVSGEIRTALLTAGLSGKQE